MRRFIQHWITSALLSVSIVAAAVGVSYGQDKVVRIGFQKYGKLVLLKGRGTLEDKLKPLGYRVAWTEFPSGPPLLEALNVGAIDFGIAGETPPIFAQAAGAPLVYLAYDPPAPREKRSWSPRTARSNRLPISRARKSR
jgi:sulfonate transport system substrate-binding protein